MHTHECRAEGSLTYSRSPGNRTEVHEAERNFDAEAREAKSLHNLTLFIGQVTEMFSFFEVMLKHGIISIKEK